MEPLSLIERHYPPGSLAYRLLVTHSRQVAGLAGAVALRLAAQQPIDRDFVHEAAWLHDIGIYLTDVPAMGCHGSAHYLEHGLLGAELLRRAGLPRHALVCERHIGVGLTAEDIRHQGLPLPQRDMLPESIEEQIVAYADLFFSKRTDRTEPRTPAEVREALARFGMHKALIFDDWHRRFEPGS